MSNWRRVSRHIGRTGMIVLACIIGLILFLWLFNWSPFTGTIARIASNRLHRQVRIGRFSAHLLWSPRVTVDRLQIANPPWAPGDLADIGRISVAIDGSRLLTGHLVLSRLELFNARLDLERKADQLANWDFTSAAGKRVPSGPNRAPSLPAVRLLTLRGGSLTMNDAVRKLHFQGSVAANQNSAHPELEPLRVQGQGQLNGKPFDLLFQGTALFNLRLDRPYRFNTQITAGEFQVLVQGSIDHPFDFEHFGATLEAKGPNLAGLYYLTGLALPFTPPFHFSGQLRNDANRFSVTALKATIGHSDLQGTVGLDVASARPLLTANLLSHSFSLSDLAPSVGAGVANKPVEADMKAPGTQGTPPGMLPDYHFQFDRLRSMDAKVQLRAQTIQSQKALIKALTINLQLKNGMLSFDPLEFTLPEGRISGAISLDARTRPAGMAIDLRLQNVNLGQFKPAKMPEAPLEGQLLSRVQLAGQGTSVHEVLGDSNGSIMVIIPHGEIRQAFAELTGVDVARGLGLLVSGNHKQVAINCAIAAFQVKQGTAKAAPIVLSTDVVKVTGSGGFSFGDETLDLQLQGQPKKFAPFRLRAPVVLHGTFAKPSVGIKPGPLLAQAGIAAALGVLATPAAAVLAFVDPGLTKDANCAQLLSGPKVESTEHPGPPKAIPPKHTTAKSVRRP